MKTEFFECECFSDEHMLKFKFDPEDKQVYVTTYLCNWYPWYKRILEAVKYVFGHKSKDGDFDTFLLKPADVTKLIKLLEEFEKQ